MKKVIVFLFIFLFSANICSASFFGDPNNFTEIINTEWKFTIGLDLNPSITIYVYNEFIQNNNPLSLKCASIASGVNVQIGIICYGDFLTQSGQGFTCLLTDTSGYTDWYEVYEFAIDGNSATGTYRTYQDNFLDSTKYLFGNKTKDNNEYSYIPEDLYFPSIPNSLYSPSLDNDNKDDDNKFGCFISLLCTHLRPCCRAISINI